MAAVVVVPAPGACRKMNMRAFVLTRYGGPDGMEFRRVPTPSAGPGEVLIQVYAAGLNPVDFKARQGRCD